MMQHPQIETSWSSKIFSWCNIILMPGYSEADSLLEFQFKSIKSIVLKRRMSRGEKRWFHMSFFLLFNAWPHIILVLFALCMMGQSLWKRWCRWDTFQEFTGVQTQPTSLWPLHLWASWMKSYNTRLIRVTLPLHSNMTPSAITSGFKLLSFFFFVFTFRTEGLVHLINVWRQPRSLSLKHSCICHSDSAYKKQNKHYLGTKIKSKLKLSTGATNACLFFFFFPFLFSYRDSTIHKSLVTKSTLQIKKKNKTKSFFFS